MERYTNSSSLGKRGRYEASITNLGKCNRLMDFSENSVAIGKTCEREGAFECDLPAYFEEPVYATVTAYTSDLRAKDIADTSIDTLLPIWHELQFALFKYRNGDNIYAGVIAQDVIKIFEKHQIDWQEYGLVLGDEDTGYSVNYEFIDQLTARMVQLLTAEVMSLKRRVEELEKK